ncbi:unnamed protein product [Ranitomeya imitator]|uniref:Tetraspanin n=1 Tax=Ranitomeya imitator TaxID=111125 RepID=A0ABN9M709_9NEOB|nr:unnamed protein product [Ranitomeya imitator]
MFEVDTNANSFYTGVYILIGAGALMMLVGFLGCCGAIQESECMLGLFFAFLLVIFAIEIAAGIWGFANKDKVVNELQTFYTETYDKYKQNQDPALKETLKSIHFAGCPNAIAEIFNKKFHIIGAVGIGIAVVMIFGMIFSMILCCAIRNNREMV